MTAVPYKGTGPAMTDLMGGQIDLMCDQTTNTTSPDRGQEGQGLRGHLAQAPDGARAEGPAHAAGVGVKDFNVSIFHGLYAPKGTPPAVLKKLNDALKQALKDPEFIKKRRRPGRRRRDRQAREPAEHKKFVASEINKWSPLIKAAGVYAD
jgi:tripartite-type tricarboxylate transporter receptor subunit TctC